MERKRTTMGEAAQIRYKSALPPMVYYPPLATQAAMSKLVPKLPESGEIAKFAKSEGGSLPLFFILLCVSCNSKQLSKKLYHFKIFVIFVDFSELKRES